jgi:fatty-acyl-CoA synthase
VISALDAAINELKAIGIGRKAGLIGGESPLSLAATFRDLIKLGAVSAALVKSSRLHPQRPAVIDELGSINYADLNAAANAVANQWRSQGVSEGDGIAILARNHRFIVIAFYAAIKVGARIVLLNTDFAGPQVREVAAREGIDLLVHDDEYTEFLAGIEPRFGRWRAWFDQPGPDTLAAVAEIGNPSAPPVPTKPAKIVVLTSGTTGTPKGAPRAEPKGLTPVAALLERAPFRSGDTVEICAPMFHSLGLAFMLLTIAMGSTVVARRKFDPAAVVASIEANKSRGMVLVPVMFARVLDAVEATTPRPDLSSLEVVLLGGSQLGGELAERGLQVLGPVVHNLYGSTEVAYATIATPEDLAAAPATVGRPVLGTVVQILGDSGRPVPKGEVGRVFVRNALPFDGYTGGGSKDVIDGLMATGDVGHFDDAGRLFIDGRDDEMIVSGGENVFPREIEELLEHHPDIADVAVVGVPDEQWGQRLRAYVVANPGETIDADALKEHVRTNLARYKVPRDVVVLDELPRNATGKILKRVLKDL